jgi:hypothetical protein
MYRDHNVMRIIRKSQKNPGVAGKGGLHTTK